jgi:hypothetical protein
LESNINSDIIANLPFGNFSFTLDNIQKVENNLIQIIPDEQSISDLFLFWVKMPLLVLTISKDKIIQKEITFTQKMVLKKQWKIFLVNYFDLS